MCSGPVLLVTPRTSIAVYVMHMQQIYHASVEQLSLLLQIVHQIALRGFEHSCEVSAVHEVLCWWLTSLQASVFSHAGCS